MSKCGFIAPTASVDGGRDTRVIMSPLPGLARTGAPNSRYKDD
jgi:hypothetical protein